MSDVKRYNVEPIWVEGRHLSTEGHMSNDGKWVRYEDHAAALAAERAKFAAFAVPDGEPMPVLGVLPVTADKAIVTLGATVWNCDQWSNCAKVLYREDSGYGAVFHTQWRPIDVCYSTRAAAEAARGTSGVG